MFDLIEQDLATTAATPETKADPKPLDVVVYVMPERFRAKVKQTSALPFLIGGIVVFLLAVTGGIVYFVVVQQQKPPITVPVQPPKEVEKAPPPPNETPTPPPVSTLKPTDESPAVDSAKTPDTPVADPQKPVTPAPDDTTPIVYVDALDTDGDNLTDDEEHIFHTDPKISDTDTDGHLDGDEIRRLFDPTKGVGALLTQSTFVNKYTNDTYHYSLVYPSAWLASAVNKSDAEVLISTPAKEYFSVKQMENPDNMPAVDFYTKVVAPGTDSSSLQSLSGETWDAVMSADGLTAYFTKKAEGVKDVKPIALIVQYIPNTSPELHFRTTFQMILKSLTFTDLTFVKK